MHKFFYFISTFRDTARVEYGPGTLNLLKKLYFSLFRANRFIVFQFDESSAYSKALENNFGTIVTDFELLDKYRLATDAPKELYSDKMHSVSSCRIVEIGNELAYIHWVYSKGDHSRFIQLSDDVAEINNVLTLPRFRGQKIAESVLRNSAKTLHNEGYSKIVAVIHDQNIASIKSFSRAGFVKIGEIRSWGPFNRRISL